MNADGKKLCGTAAERASRLGELIRAEVDGERFVPEMSYLRQNTHFGRVVPCGCAIAMAAHVTGAEGELPDAMYVREHLRIVGVSDRDSVHLERGYEDANKNSVFRDEHAAALRLDQSDPFYKLGAELGRAYHPERRR